MTADVPPISAQKAPFKGRQPYSEGILSRAVHGVTFSFALDFLGLTTFLRQILGKIYLSDFLTTPHLFYY